MNTKAIILGTATVAAGCVMAALQPMPKGELPDPAGLAINAGRKIAFAHPLPRMRCGKTACGTYNNWELAFPGLLTTMSADFGNTLWDLRKVVWADRRLVFVDGRTLVCQLNWIRDHIHQMKGYRHWEHDLTSFLDFILDTQRADGQFYELIKQLDDFHWTFVPPDCRILYPDDNQSLVRLELEADIEYLMVEGCMQAWRVTGDDDWLRRALPRLEKGIDYMTRSPKRWDKTHGLCMRPYTIDTWDFTNDPLSGSNRSVILSEPMAVMHGDNSGVFQAMNQLAWINERFGNAAKASEWRARAEALKANMFKHLWNGKFFCHQLPLNCEPLDAHEKERLSLSMAYALNRGLLTLEQKRGVVAEYKTRRNMTKGFSEWFTIDPAYCPVFKGYPPGQYVNGALSPFTAGELARGAFECGEEAYGWDILDRVAKMVKRDDGKLYFLYDPISGKPQGRGPSAWGAAAILAAVDEGLAGVQDLDAQYRKIRFAPRWAVTPFDEGRYLTGYEASHKTVDVRWIFTDKGFRYHLRSPAKKVSAHLLVPSGKVPDSLYVNGTRVPFSLATVGDSRYVDADVTPQAGIADFEVLYAAEAWFGAPIPSSGEDGREDCGMTAARVFDAPIAGLERIGTLAVPQSADLPESSNASIGFECLDRGLFDPDRCYDTLAAAGVKWARCQTMWSRCEKRKGVYDFTVLDGVVNNLTRRGIRPWFSVTFGNTLYMTNCFTGAAVGCVPTLYGEECRAAWCAYVRALARRYKGKVTHWEIWNEPNIKHFWQPSTPNADDYLELVKLTGGVIREEIPDAKIGGTTSSAALNAWEKRFFDAGGAAAIDFWCGHAYTRVPERLRREQRIASGSSFDYVAVLKDVRAFIDAHGGKHVEIWQGESGFPSWFPAGHWLWWPRSICQEGWQSQANQAKWLLRRFVTDRRSGIARSSFFQMADISRHYSMALTTQKHPAEHGIVNGWTYKPKMSCRAFGHYNALLATARHDDSVAVSITTASDAGAPTVATTFCTADGKPLFLYYTAYDFSGSYTGTCYTARCDAKLTVPTSLAPKDPVLVDMLRGGVYAVAVDGRAGARPSHWDNGHLARCEFTNLPLVDYPLVLTDRSAVKLEPAGCIEKLLDSYVSAGRIAGVVSVLSDKDYHVQFDCAGWAERGKRKMMPDTLFAIFSMTKTFTGAAIMCAIDDGKLSLDDEVAKYLPEFADVKMKDGSKPNRPLTIRHLTTHTTGWRGGTGVINRDIPLREVARQLAARPLSFQPGETFAYGNAWICTAAACLEVAVGKPYEEFLKERILDPLGMKDTTFTPNAEQLTRLVCAYTSDDKPLRPAADHCVQQIVFPKAKPLFPSASGGLFSTPRDMVAFSQMLAHHGEWKGKTIISRKTFDSIFAVKQTSAGITQPYTCGSWLYGDWFGHEGAMRTDQRANLRTGHSRVFFIQTENKAGSAFFQLKKDWHAAADKIQGTPPTVFGN